MNRQYDDKIYNIFRTIFLVMCNIKPERLRLIKKKRVFVFRINDLETFTLSLISYSVAIFINLSVLMTRLYYIEGVLTAL